MEHPKLDTWLKALAAMPPVQLRLEWKALSGQTLANAPANLLRHLIAYRLQEKLHGKLPAQIERQLGRLTNNAGRNCTNTISPRGSIGHGTKFIREWNGKTIAVTAVDDGFEWEGETYRSLSQIARKITGAHWSGPRFFGLRACEDAR